MNALLGATPSFLSPEKISLYLDLLVVLFLVLGFLWGLKRGLKKATVRFIFILTALALAFFTTALIFEKAMDIKLSFLKIKESGVKTATSVNGYVDYLISDMGIDTVAFAGTINLAKGLVLMVLNTIGFLLLFTILKAITWPIYAMVTAKKKNRDEPKKRLWGGLVGLLQGAVLAIVLFVPISGFSKMLNTLADPITEIEAVQKAVPDNILDYKNVYKKSVFGKVLNFAPETLFRGLTTQKISGVKVSLLDELDAIAGVVKVATDNDVIDKVKKPEDLLNFLSEDVAAASSENMRPVKRADTFYGDFVNKLFKMKSVRIVLVDASNYAAKELEVAERIQAKDINWKEEKNKLTGVLSGLTVGVSPLLSSADISANLETMDMYYLADGLTKMKNLDLTKHIYEPGVNKVLAQFKGSIPFNFGNLNLTNINWYTTLDGVQRAYKLANGGLQLNDLQGGDITGILNILKETGLLDVMEDQLKDLMKDAIFNDPMKDNSWLDSVEFDWEKDTEAIGAALNMVSVMNGLDTEEGYNAATIAQIGDSFEALGEMSDGMATVMTNMMEDKFDIDMSGKDVRDLAYDGEAMCAILQVGFSEEGEDSISGEDLVDALDGSTMLLDLLTESETVFDHLTPEKQDEIEAALNNRTDSQANVIRKLFNMPEVH